VRQLYQESSVKVLVFSPTWRNYEAHNVFSLMNLLTHPEITWHPSPGDADIARARSRAATYFIERSDADVLLSIDSDISFEDNDALSICRQAMTHDIVCGIYVTRSRFNGVTASRLNLDQRVNFGADRTPVEILWAAGGFTAIHRRVFERLADDPEMILLHPNDPTLRMRPFYLPMCGVNEEGEPIYISEDWSVCERARRAGFKVYCNPAVRLEHIGTTRFVLEDLYAKAPERKPMAITRTTDGVLIEHD
jgi:hypothetical protein